MKYLWWLVLALSIGAGPTLFGNGGAWQTGVHATGNVSASNQKQHTDVTIENEAAKIDLNREYAEVDVHYRMRNTGPKVQQDFFFPVERWAEESDNDDKPSDVEHYQISVDGEELAATDVPGPKSESPEKISREVFDDPIYTIKSWKKSVIPFERNQIRDVTIHYRARYAEHDEGVSDDTHMSNQTFAYSLSPAATWKGPIGKGKIEVNVLHPEPEDVSIEKPKKRFRKVSDTHYEWAFENLKPKLADDIRIIAHSKYDSYLTRYSQDDGSQDDGESRDSYVLRGYKYFLDHFDYDATASSTLPPKGEDHYEIEHIKGRGGEWAEGVDGDGIGENIMLSVKRPLPLYGILIRPEYREDGSDKKNSRLAALEITLNDEKTFTETIPDEIFRDPYLIRVRDYAKPVSKIKLVIKGAHPGTQSQDTSIALVELRAPLAKKPQVHHSR